MTASRRDVLLALPASALLPALAGAQPPAGQPPAASKDPLLAPCLLIGGRKQIENCSYALKKLQSDEAKAFAKAEIEEHETIKKNLKGLGFDYPVTPVAAAQPGQPVSWAVSAGGVKLPMEAATMVAVDYEVAEQCIANYRTEMDTYSRREFDKRFVGHQLDEHMSLLDKVQTFRRHASPKMGAILADGQKVIETHIATLKKLMTALDKGGEK
jgi:predicted outer membrane protein